MRERRHDVFTTEPAQRAYNKIMKDAMNQQAAPYDEQVQETYNEFSGMDLLKIARKALSQLEAQNRAMVDKCNAYDVLVGFLGIVDRRSMTGMGGEQSSVLRVVDLIDQKLTEISKAMGAKEAGETDRG